MAAPHPSARSCRHARLAQTRLCRIERCEHGTVHVTLGDLTLRLRAEDVVDISRAFAEASAQLPAAEDARPARLC